MEMNYFYGITAVLILLSVISGILSKRMTSEKGIMRPRRPRNFFISPIICSVILSALTYFTWEVCRLYSVWTVHFVFGLLLDLFPTGVSYPTGEIEA